ncbi:hypothetical protein CPB84DRAFT_1825504 [Gymnopilus junonius]|uniref:Zn(2)-C6 fungal-type domain-containing protein n=1 Tax=Gymnopilus junonius TaxID=109634 RepID=A0A9P5NL87_GYMJU|nr:hypothetical protein CPB84DRAFT_1825504 [Gymnopilus junonius]
MSMYNDTSQQHPLYQEDDERYLQYAELESHSDTQQFAASSSQIHPLPHAYPLFTRQENMNSSSNRSLDPHVLTSHHSVQPSPSSFATLQHQPQLASHEPPHGWTPYQLRVSQQYTQSDPSPISVSYPSASFPCPSPFPPTRLSPPPAHQPAHYKGQGPGVGLSHGSSSGLPSTGTNSRLTFAGSLDPATGIFYRTPEHPRLRTAQACEKCRTRKAKCSGEHPSCKRCITRGLACEYAKEGRVRGPNKPKSRSSIAVPTGGGGSLQGPSHIAVPDTTSPSDSLTSASETTSRNRTSSIHSSSSSEHPSEMSQNQSSLRSPLKGPSAPAHHGYMSMLTSSGSDLDSYGSTISRNLHSLSESRTSRSRPPDLQLKQLSAASGLYRLAGGNVNALLRDNSCTTDPYYRYQEQYESQPFSHQDRELFSVTQSDQHPNAVGQQQHQLHSLPSEHVRPRSREVPQMQTQGEYPSGIIDQAGNVLVHGGHSLANYGVEEDTLTYLPPPETFVSHHSQLQSHHAQMSHHQRTYDELLDQGASRWPDPSSEGSCLNSAHMSMSGNGGMGVATGSLAPARLGPSASAAASGLGGRARLLMTDYSHRQHQPILQSQVQATELHDVDLTVTGSTIADGSDKNVCKIPG